jgi:hypothetical protein
MKLVDRRHRVYVSFIAVMLITIPIINSGWKAPSKQILRLDRVTVIPKNQTNPTLDELAGATAQAEPIDDTMSDTQPVIDRSGWWI